MFISIKYYDSFKLLQVCSKTCHEMMTKQRNRNVHWTSNACFVIIFSVYDWIELVWINTLVTDSIDTELFSLHGYKSILSSI